MKEEKDESRILYGLGYGDRIFRMGNNRYGLSYFEKTWRTHSLKFENDVKMYGTQAIIFTSLSQK